jgi:hypothetical protein
MVVCTKLRIMAAISPPPPREEVPRYQLNMRLGGPQSQSGRRGEKISSRPRASFSLILLVLTAF